MPKIITIILLVFLWWSASVNAQQPNNKPVSVATPIILESTNSNSTSNAGIDDKSNQLLEYQLAEKVEQRVFRNLTVYGTILAIALAIIGFLGFTFIYESIANRVEKSLKESIEKEVENLKSRIQTSLVESQISVSENKKILDTAQSQLKDFHKAHSELEDISAKYTNLHNNVNEISSRVEEALTSANQSMRKTDELSDAIESSFAGEPTVLGGSFNWEVDAGGSVSGTNFGNNPGKIYITLVGYLLEKNTFKYLRHSVLLSTEAEKEFITSWSEREIKFVLPEVYTEKIKKARENVEVIFDSIDSSKSFERNLHFNYKVETADGRLSNNLSKLPPFVENKAELNNPAITPIRPRRLT